MQPQHYENLQPASDAPPLRPERQAAPLHQPQQHGNPPPASYPQQPRPEGQAAPPYVMLDPVNAEEPASYPATSYIVLGGLQVGLGILVFLIQGVLTGLFSVTLLTGAGFYSGILSIITGGFGIAAGKRKGNCLIIAYLVLTVLTCVFAGVLTFVPITGFILDERMVPFIFNGILMLCGLGLLATSIWGATLYCQMFCSCCQNKPTVATAAYHADNRAFTNIAPSNIAPSNIAVPTQQSYAQ